MHLLLTDTNLGSQQLISMLRICTNPNYSNYRHLFLVTNIHIDGILGQIRPKFLCRIVAHIIDHGYSKHSSLYGSGRSRGGARGTQAPPLFLDQTEAQRAEKNFFGDPPPPPYLTVWMTRAPLI